jgi:hypothetical protein
MKAFLNWSSWIAAAVSTYLILMGCLGYLLGNMQIFGVKYDTYLTFGGYFVLLAIMVILLKISVREK